MKKWLIFSLIFAGIFCKKEPVKMTLIQTGQKTGFIDMAEPVSYFRGSHSMGTIGQEVFLDIRGAANLVGKLEAKNLLLTFDRGRLAIKQHYIKRFAHIKAQCGNLTIEFVKGLAIFLCSSKEQTIMAVEGKTLIMAKGKTFELKENDLWSSSSETIYSVKPAALKEYTRVFTNPYLTDKDIDYAKSKF